ncbi:MAG: DUF2786 domain-containing protein [Pseudomonadota bacterium]
MSNERDRIVERVRALLSMTVDNGCTEAEAMTAADKAAQLMAEHDLTYTDVEDVNDTRIAQQSAPMPSGQNRRHMHAAGLYAAVAIGDFFDCKCWRDQTEIIFFGDRDDVMLAHVTLNMIRVAMDRELEVFMSDEGCLMDEHPATLKASFLRGMGERISTRFIALKHDRWRKSRSRGNELVVLKGELVDAEFAKLFPNGLGRAHRQKPVGSELAYAYGVDAGNRQNILTDEVVYDDSDEAREHAARTTADQRAMRWSAPAGFFGWLRSAAANLGILGR